MTMGYQVTVGQRLFFKQSRQIEKAIQDTFQEIHDCCNPWNPCSELSRFNQKGIGSVTLSPMLTELFVIIDRCVEETDGKFDPTIGVAWSKWYSALMCGKYLSEEEIEPLRRHTGWKSQFELRGSELIKKSPQTQVDVCGVAKGFCVDVIAHRLKGLGVKHALIEWGGEVYAFGNHPENRNWKVALRDQGHAGNKIDFGIVQLCEGGIASSGISQRRWLIDKGESEMTYYHFLDPISLEPRSEDDCLLLFCSIEATSCALADAYATTCMLFSSLDELKSWVQQNGSIRRFFALSRKGESLSLTKCLDQTNSNFLNAGKLDH